jgi:hypothetical protein
MSMPGRWIAAGVVACLVGWGGAPAEAHLKDYLVSQYFYTAKKGEVEVTFWNDVNMPEADEDDSYHSKHQVELEYGLTDWWQVAYYEVYTWSDRNDWDRDALKLETKLRLAEAGAWPVDVALYLEYKNPNGSRDVRSDVIEPKLILSKDLGPWNLIVNLITERKINENAPWEFEYTAGVSYAATPRTRLGVELKQGLGDSDEVEFSSRQPLYLVPGIYTSLTPHIRVLAGPAIGLTKPSDELQLLSRVEIEF